MWDHEMEKIMRTSAILAVGLLESDGLTGVFSSVPGSPDGKQEMD